MTRPDGEILLHLATVIAFDDDFVLYDLAEVSDITGLSRSRVAISVRAGTLAAVHHGGKWMVAREEVQRFRKAFRGSPERRPLSGVPRRFVPPPRPGDVEPVG